MLKRKFTVLVSVLSLLAFSSISFAAPPDPEEAGNAACPFRIGINITQDEFLEHFIKSDKDIGAGEEAHVYKVRKKTTGTEYALVLKNAPALLLKDEHGFDLESIEIKDRKNFIQRLIEYQDCNPYQAKIFGYFWIENRNFPLQVEEGQKKGIQSYSNLREGRILNDIYKNDSDAILYRHEAILMELGVGDLEGEDFKKLGIDPILKSLTPRLGHYSLLEQNLWLRDFNPKNHIFVHTETQIYKGHRLIDYNFFQYTFSTHTFYIPIGSFIIKRIDFQGEIRRSLLGIINIASLAREFKTTKESIISRFCQQPPQDSKILVLPINN